MAFAEKTAGRSAVRPGTPRTTERVAFCLDLRKCGPAPRPTSRHR